MKADPSTGSSKGVLIKGFYMPAPHIAHRLYIFVQLKVICKIGVVCFPVCMYVYHVYNRFFEFQSDFF